MRLLFVSSTSKSENITQKTSLQYKYISDFQLVQKYNNAAWGTKSINCSLKNDK